MLDKLVEVDVNVLAVNVVLGTPLRSCMRYSPRGGFEITRYKKMDPPRMGLVPNKNNVRSSGHGPNKNSKKLSPDPSATVKP